MVRKAFRDLRLCQYLCSQFYSNFLSETRVWRICHFPCRKMCVHVCMYVCVFKKYSNIQTWRGHVWKIGYLLLWVEKLRWLVHSMNETKGWPSSCVCDYCLWGFMFPKGAWEFTRIPKELDSMLFLFPKEIVPLYLYFLFIILLLQFIYLEFWQSHTVSPLASGRMNIP